MSDEGPDADQSSQTLGESLSEIRQSLETFGRRLYRLEVSPGGLSAATGGSSPDPSSVEDPDRRDALSIGREILDIPSSELDPSQVFSVALDLVARLLSADRAMVFAWEPDGARLVALAGRGFRRDDLETMAISPGAGLVGQVYQHEQVLRASTGTAGFTEDPFLAHFPVRDAVAVPIRAAGHAVGVLYAGRRVPRPAFSEQEILLLLLVADRVGTALVRRQRLHDTDGHINRLRELEGFLGDVLVGRGMEDMLSRACDVARRLVRVRVAAIGVPAGSGLSLAAASGLPASGQSAWRADTGSGLTAELFTTERPVLCRDIQSRDGCESEALREAGMRACLVVPIRLRHRTLGALYVADTEPREFTPDEVAAVEVLASLLALGMENDRLYGEARTALEGLAAAQDQRLQAEKARVVGAMAGGIANEFNNLLAIILGKTQLMLARVPDGPLREGLTAVEEAAWRAADMVRRLHGFAPASENSGAGPVDLATVVRDAIELTAALWKDLTEERGTPIEVVSHLEQVPSVDGHAPALRQAVMNLIQNAVEAMPTGGRLGLGLRPVDSGVELQVSDAGEGMPEDVQPRIFDPFFTTRAPHRTGLGLSVVHGVVNRHGGRVRVTSARGGGTTVTLWFPASGREPAMSDTPLAAPPAEMPLDEGERDAGVPLTVLLIEDEEHIRAMLMEALSGAGHIVESATDGLTGLARFQGRHFDVVLTDLSLPECSGLDVARSVKRMRPETRVVLITGWGHLLDPDRVRDCGVDAMLGKPFRLERVLSALGAARRLRPKV